MGQGMEQGMRSKEVGVNNRTKARACKGKARFSSPSFAERVAAHRNGRYGLGDWDMRYHAYFCSYCRGWHVGHRS
jgi:hypothetical protein